MVLLHVTPGKTEEAAHGAFAGLLGRGYRQDPGRRLAELSDEAATALLDAAAGRLARPARQVRRHGRVEREVAAALHGADLLVVARDGDRSRLGPRSLEPATRFVVDHAPCAILLIWPGPVPGLDSVPLPPAGRHPPSPSDGPPPRDSHPCRG